MRTIRNIIIQRHPKHKASKANWNDHDTTYLFPQDYQLSDEEEGEGIEDNESEEEDSGSEEEIGIEDVVDENVTEQLVGYLEGKDKDDDDEDEDDGDVYIEEEDVPSEDEYVEDIVKKYKKKVRGGYKTKRNRMVVQTWDKAIKQALSSTRKGMSCKAIWKKIERLGLYDTVGNTPTNSINAAISRNINMTSHDEVVYERVSTGKYRLKM